MAKMGAPLKVINWDDLTKLCRMQCTGEEAASFLEVDYDTLNSACKREHGLTFSEYFAEKAPSGRASLRRAQFTLALGSEKTPPNPTMLIWLGKQMLGQKDKLEFGGDPDNPVAVTFNYISPKVLTDETK